jgi:hypothetical protein
MRSVAIFLFYFRVTINNSTATSYYLKGYSKSFLHCHNYLAQCTYIHVEVTESTPPYTPTFYFTRGLLKRRSLQVNSLKVVSIVI